MEELPRHQPSNPLGLSKLDQIQRRREVRELHEIYPYLPINIIEDVWEYHYLQDPTELKEKIESGYFEKPIEPKKELKE